MSEVFGFLLEDLPQGPVHGVCQYGVNISLIFPHVFHGTARRRAIVGFTYHKRTSRLTELRPEVLGDLNGRIEPVSVKFELVSQVVNPAEQGLTHEWMTLIQVRQVRQPVVLYFPLIPAFFWPFYVRMAWMKVLEIIKRNKIVETLKLLRPSTVGIRWISHVISHEVRHHPNISSVTGFHQRFKVLPGPKMRVYFKYVLGPVTMVTFIGVLHDGRDPNSIESQAGDVVEILLDAFKSSTTVVLQIRTLLGWYFTRRRKTVCKELKKKTQNLYYY